jgi:hypothetical protein
MGDAATEAALFQSPSFAQRFILTPFKRFFDAIWHVLAYIVGVIVVGGILVNILTSLATTGSPGLADPTTWAISRPILANPTFSLALLGGLICLGTISYAVHRGAHGDKEVIPEPMIQEYGLGMVQNVVPTPTMIPFYRPSVYIPRRDKDSGVDADALARETLAAAAARNDPSRFAAQVGICVIGRKLLGSTRLAWQAIHTIGSSSGLLSTWTFVRWPENASQYVELWQDLQKRLAKVVLWLDDLAKYQDERNASLIARLPFDLEERHIPFIVIATLHNDEVEDAHARFGGLLDHLLPIHPSDLTTAEANTLIEQLRGAGESVFLADRFDGTPGSIVLAVDHMRDQVYPRLSDGAKAILRSIKLLRSAGIRAYTLERTLRTAAILSKRKHPNWTPDLEALQGAGFLRQSVLDSGRVVLLEPIAEVYLDVAIPDYSQPPSATNEWPQLLESFTQASDGYALVRLGDAFRRSSDDDRAEVCYHGALGFLTRATAEHDWAMAQFGLGDVLSRRVEVADPLQRRKLLEDAEDAFNSALHVVSREGDPTFWAEIQGRLAGVIRHEATTTVGRTKRVDMLDSAEKKVREALKILRRDTAPEDWATAQRNLGLVLLTHAQFAQDADVRRRMLDGAREALTAALAVFIRQDYEYQWARLQHSLAEACRKRAEASNRPRKEELLKQAIDAYGNALSVSMTIPVWRPIERAEMLSQLSMCRYSLGMLLDGNAREELLAQAAEEAHASAEVYSSQNLQELAARASQFFGTIQYERANMAPDGSQTALLDTAIEANVEALARLGHQGPKELRPQLRLDLARLFWARATFDDQSAAMVVQNDIEETAKYSALALQYFTRANAPAEYQLAARLQRDAKNRARALGARPADVRAISTDTAPSSEHERQYAGDTVAKEE